MFRDIIDSFRSKTRDKILCIYENAESDESYQLCCEFLDEYTHEDDDDMLVLSDYITYGHFGEGTVNKRLLKTLALTCQQYAKKIPLHSNNKSYCNSMMTAIERAENYLLQVRQ